jgi:hypothetical protein
VVFENTDFVPERAERHGGPVSTGSSPGSLTFPGPGDLQGFHAALGQGSGAQSYAGVVDGGTVVSSYAPAGRWQLKVNGVTQSPAPAYGWADQYPAVLPGAATLEFRGNAIVPVALTLEILLWLAVVAALSGPSRLRRRRRRRAQPPAAAPRVPHPPPPPRPGPRHAAVGSSS